MNALDLKYINQRSRLFYLWWPSYSDNHYNILLFYFLSFFLFTFFEKPRTMVLIWSGDKTSPFQDCWLGLLRTSCHPHVNIRSHSIYVFKQNDRRGFLANFCSIQSNIIIIFPWDGSIFEYVFPHLFTV